MSNRSYRDDKDRKKKKDRDCGDCTPGCGALGDLGCDLLMISLFTVALGYFTVAPVIDGNLTTRPARRLIRSCQTNVSAHRGPVCNLTPTCSAYGYEALSARGVRGLLDLRARLRDCREAGATRRAQGNP